jgi:hypothetical protein
MVKGHSARIFVERDSDVGSLVKLLILDFGARLSGHLSANGCASFLLKVIEHTVNEAKHSNERRPPSAPVLQPSLQWIQINRKLLGRNMSALLKSLNAIETTNQYRERY